MSLTGLLEIGHGPVWEWFAEHFPQTQRVSTQANRELRPGGTVSDAFAFLDRGETIPDELATALNERYAKIKGTLSRGE